MTPDRPKPDAPTLARQTGEWHALTLPPGGDELAPAPPLPADAVPGYELLGEIGRGGMGVVYRARHLGLNRIVALKMVLAGAHARGADLQRFRAEAEAIARLQHPNVVQVYDVGEANGLPYLSLELCAGSLADRLDGIPWPPKPAAELVETLARAVHAAHQAGVLHRDIKPANVLLASRERERPEDGFARETPVAHAPGSPGFLPKLTDFGLAKRLDGSRAGPTATGAILGTPSYMAPEQAGRTSSDGRSQTIGPAVDVYALGAILYELLTGRPPFLAASPLDTLLQVTRDEPVPPARLNPKTPRDIQTICLKCLEKEPSRRYATAAALADDLHRYLADEPIAARPVPAWEKCWKWAKRRPTQAALVAVSVAAVVLLIAGSWYFTGQLQVERDNAMWAMTNAKLSETAAIANGHLAGKNLQRAEAEALNARRQNYVLAMGQAQLAWQQAAVDRLKNLLRDQEPKPGEEDLRGFEWHYWNRVTRGAPRQFGPVKYAGRTHSGFGAVAYSPDKLHLAATTNSGMAFIWDLASGSVVQAFMMDPGTSADNVRLAYRPDGKQIALGDAKEVRVSDTASGVTMWRAEQPALVTGLAYTSDGTRLVTRAGGRARIYDAAGGGLLRTCAKPNNQGGGLAISPDGQRIIAGGYPGQVIDIETGQLIREVTGGYGVAVSPDGEQIAFIADEGGGPAVEIRVVSANTGRIAIRGRAHAEFGRAINYSPDGKFIATAGRDNTARLWDPATGKEVRRFLGHSRENAGVAFSPDGRSLAVGNKTVEVWPVDFDQEATTVKAHATLGTQSLALDASAGRVFGAGLFGGLIDDSATRKTVAKLGGAGLFGGPSHAAFSADGTRVAAGFDGGTVMVWDALTGRQLWVATTLKNYVTAIGFSADGRRLAAASRADVDEEGDAKERPEGQTDRVVVWDLEKRALLRDLTGPEVEEVNSVALTADGRLLVIGSGKLTARLWDVDAGTRMHTLHARPGYGNFQTAVAISPDGRWAAYADNAQVSTDISLYAVAGGKLAHTFAGHQRGARKVAFSPDVRRLASTSDDDTVRVWDVITGQEVLSRPAPRNVVDLGFSRDGRRLSAVAADGTLRTWAGD